MVEAEGFWLLYKSYQVFQIAFSGTNLLIHILYKIVIYFIKCKK